MAVHRKVPFEVVQIDYQWTNEHIKMLTDIRFRLLAFGPPLVTVAVTLLSTQTFGTGAAAPQHGGPGLTLTAGIGLLGFIFTFGVVLYDLRNSQLYNALVHRAKVLEGVLGCVGSGSESVFPPSSASGHPLGLQAPAPQPNPYRRLASQGGLHSQRAKQHGTFLGAKIGHSPALAIIQSALLAACVFPIVKAVSVGAGLLARHFWADWSPTAGCEMATSICGLATSIVALSAAVIVAVCLIPILAGKDPGRLATFLGYREPVEEGWELDFKDAVAHYEELKSAREKTAH